MLVEVEAGGESGIGWTYARPPRPASIADAARAAWSSGMSALDDRRRAPRDAGRACGTRARPGSASMALSAVDVALWDLKAKLLGVPLATLLGAVRDEVPVYGSGGFCSYSDAQLADQLAGWVERRASRA